MVGNGFMQIVLNGKMKCGSQVGPQTPFGLANLMHKGNLLAAVVAVVQISFHNSWSAASQKWEACVKF
jgi:hypothetical protein